MRMLYPNPPDPHPAHSKYSNQVLYGWALHQAEKEIARLKVREQELLEQCSRVRLELHAAIACARAVKASPDDYEGD